MDEEKIFKGLEYCTTHYNCRNTRAKDCPYINECKPIDNATGNTLMRDALELLKEQENDLRIMFNRCQATAKLLTSGSSCNGCIMREKCERLTKYEP